MPEQSISSGHDIAALAQTLAELLSQTSEESRYHLMTALGARDFDGVSGDLLIRVPRRSKEHVVVKWVGGQLSAL